MAALLSAKRGIFAATTTYTSEASFLAANPSGLTLQDFESPWTTANSVSFPGFTAAYPGPGSIVRSASYPTSGTYALQITGDTASSYLTFTFASAINTFGINIRDYGTAGFPSQLQLLTGAGDNLTLAASTTGLPSGDTIEYGLRNTTPFTTVQIRTTGNGDSIHLDELRYGLLSVGGGNWLNATNTNNAWSTGANWSSGVQPTSSDNATFALNSTYTVSFSANANAYGLNVAAGTVTFNLGGSTLAVAGADQLINSTGSTPKLTLDGGTLTMVAGSRLAVGRNGAGQLVVQNGGKVLGGEYLTTADAVGGSGTVTITGLGSSITANQMYSGENGSGTIIIAEGGLLSTYKLHVGADAGPGRVTVGSTTADVSLISIGTINSSSGLYIGGNAGGSGNAGTLTINPGGRVTVVGQTKVWNDNSKINLTGGMLKTGTLDIGGTPSRFSWGGGTLELTNAPQLKIIAGGMLGSAVTIDNSKALITSAQVYIGETGNASVTQTGGLHTTGADVYIGHSNGSNGTYTLSGTGSFNAGADLIVGRVGNGTFIQSGGQVNVNNGAPLRLAFSATSTAHYNLSGGTLNATGEERIGESGQATFIQTGGAHTVAGALQIGYGSGAGTFNLSGGSVSAANVSVGGSTGSAAGTGVVNIASNASLTTPGTMKVWNTGAAAPDGTRVNFSGGTLTVGTLDTSGNASRFNWTVGTLEINDSDTSIGTGGPLGTNVTLGSVGVGKHLRVVDRAGGSVTGALTVPGTGSLHVTGGSVYSRSLDVSNANSFSFTGGTITVNGGAMTPKLGGFSVSNNGGFFSPPTSMQISGSSASDAPLLQLIAGGTVSVANTSGSSVYIGHSGNRGSVLVNALGSPGGSIVPQLNAPAGSIYVGYSQNTAGTLFGTGSLTLANGGQARSASSFLIGEAGGSGYASVDGENSMLSSSGGYFYLGDFGYASAGTFSPSVGTLLLTNGGQAATLNPSYISYVGSNGGMAYASITGANSKLSSNGRLLVAESGHLQSGVFYPSQGTLTITNGGQAIGATETSVGMAGGKGFASVDGADSKLVSTSSILAGVNGFDTGSTFYAGEGTLILSNGGQASSASSAYIGVSGGKGYASVDGADSKLTNTGGLLFVASNGRVASDGFHPSEGTLNLTSGGHATATTDAYFGYFGGKGQVRVAAGFLSVGEQLHVGYGTQLFGGTTYRGTGTLVISNAGSVTSSRGVIGSVGGVGTVTLTDVGTNWANTSHLYIGNDSSGGTFGSGTGYLSITNAATLTNGGMMRVYASGTLINTGGGITTHDLDLASAGSFSFTGGVITVDGGQFIGQASVGTMDISGTGTPVLRLVNGGTASVTQDAYFGVSPTGAANSGILLLADGTATFGNHLEFGVGDTSTSAGTVLLSGSSLLTAGQMVFGLGGGSGAAEISGTNSHLRSLDSIYVGNSVGDAPAQGMISLSVGTVSAANVIVLASGGGRGRATVDGPASSLEVTNGELHVGEAGQVIGAATFNPSAGTISVTGGAKVSSASTALIGWQGGKGFVSVDGGNSRFVATSGNLNIGGEVTVVGPTVHGGVGTASIINGGYMEGGEFLFGYIAGTAIATVDGANSKLLSRIGFNVGHSAYDGDHRGTGTLIVSNGGEASCIGSDIVIGHSGGIGFASADGATTVMHALGGLYVGYNAYDAGTEVFGSVGTLNLTNGAHAITDSGAPIGVAGGTGVVNVTGSSLAVTQVLAVGGSAYDPTHAGGGTLIVTGAGSVTSNGALIGYSGGIGTVSLSGAGSAWTNTADLELGNDGTGSLAGNGSGTVIVSTGALLANTGALRVYTDGHLILSGGTVQTGTADFGGDPSRLNWSAGTFNVTSSDLTVGAGAALGAPLTIGAGKSLVVTQTTIIDAGSTLTVGGGYFSTGSLQLNGALSLNSGTFVLANANLTVGGGGLFGGTLSVGAGMNARVNQATTVNANSRIGVLGGSFRSGTISNTGRLSVIDGEFTFDSLSTNNVGGQLSAIDATLNFGTGTADRFTNLGRMNLINTAVNGELRSPGGSIIDVGGSVIFNGPFSGGATFPGAGNVTFNDLFSPGDSPASISFSGNFKMGTSAILEMEIGGVTPGSQHDFLDITGSATLAGAMRVKFLNGFVLLPGDSIPLMAWAGHTGTVDVINGTSYAGLGFVPSYSASGLSVTADALAGDADLNGVVATADFTALAVNFNQSGMNWLGGDFNHDGKVNALDFNAIATNFGQTFAGSSPAPALGAAVPEPGALAIVSLCAWPLRRSRR